MRYVYVVLVVLSCGASLGLCRKLPSYIKPCKKSDPQFHECVFNNGKEAIFKHMIYGDESYHLPPLDPMVVPRIDLITPNFNVTLLNAHGYGLHAATVKELDFNLEKKLFKLLLHLPVVNVISDFETDGKVLVLQITGSGKANLTLTDAIYDAKANYELVEKNGKKYIKLLDPVVDIDANKVYFDFSGLFKDQKEIEEQFRTLLEKNWRVIFDELRVPLSSSAGFIVRNILEKYLNLVPYDEIFLE